MEKENAEFLGDSVKYGQIIQIGICPNKFGGHCKAFCELRTKKRRTRFTTTNANPIIESTYFILPKIDMIFKASLDKLSKLLTVVITTIFAAVIVGNIFLFGSGEHLVAVLCILLIGGIYITTYLFRIKGYEVKGDTLIIHRPVKNIFIPITAIARGRKIEKDELNWSLRTFGNGGLFGYTGYFTNKRIGPMRWYATRLDKGVLLQTHKGQNILLTPNEPEALLHALQR